MQERLVSEEELRQSERRDGFNWPGYWCEVGLLSGLFGLVLTAGGVAIVWSPQLGERLGGLACLLFGVVLLTVAVSAVFASMKDDEQPHQPQTPPRPGRRLAVALRRLVPPAGCLVPAGIIGPALLCGGILFVISICLRDPSLASSEDPPDMRANWTIGILAIVFGLLGVAACAGVMTWRFPILRGVPEPRVEVSAHPLRGGGRCEMYLSQAGPLRLKRLRVRLVGQHTLTFLRVEDDGEKEIVSRSETVSETELLSAADLSIPLRLPYEAAFSFTVPALADPPDGRMDWDVVVELTFRRGSISSFEYSVCVLPTQADFSTDALLDASNK